MDADAAVGSTAATGAARRARERRKRSEGRRALWLASVCQAAASHHTGQQPATGLSSLLAEVASLRAELRVLSAAVRASMGATGFRSGGPCDGRGDGGSGVAAAASAPAGRECAAADRSDDSKMVTGAGTKDGLRMVAAESHAGGFVSGAVLSAAPVFDDGTGAARNASGARSAADEVALNLERAAREAAVAAAEETARKAAEETARKVADERAVHEAEKERAPGRRIACAVEKGPEPVATEAEVIAGDATLVNASASAHDQEAANETGAAEAVVDAKKRRTCWRDDAWITQDLQHDCLVDAAVRLLGEFYTALDVPKTTAELQLIVLKRVFVPNWERDLDLALRARYGSSPDLLGRLPVESQRLLRARGLRSGCG